MPPLPSADPHNGRFAFVVNGVQYESTQFRTRDGLRLSLLLTALGGEAAVAVIGAIAGGASLSSLMDAKIDGLDKIDLSKLRPVFLDGTVEAFIFDVLRQTFRNGKTLDESKPGNALDEFRPPRGSFADLYLVALKVIQGNGWMPLPPGLFDKLATAATAKIAEASMSGSSDQESAASGTG